MDSIPDSSKTPAAELVRASLDELAREGARRLIAAALEAEVADYVARLRGERDADGRALVVRNGRARPRTVTVGAGAVEVTAPRVNDERVVDGQRQRFASRILPPYARRSPNVAEVLPLLYLHGLSTGDFQAVLPTLLGEDAAGLSPSTITRLTQAWAEEYSAFRKRDRSGVDYVYVWADGVHFNIRLEEDRLCTLVLVGARPDGTKEVIAVEDGYRESKESWATVLRDLAARGDARAPVLAVGDQASGFWAALGGVWPTTLVQTCWVHRLVNVLDKLPDRLRPRARRLLHEAMYAESRAAAEKAIAAFSAEFGAKYPKAVDSLNHNQDRLLTYFGFPAEHWAHLRTTNPIDSTF